MLVEIPAEMLSAYLTARRSRPSSRRCCDTGAVHSAGRVARPAVFRGKDTGIHFGVNTLGLVTIFAKDMAKLDG